MAISSPCTTFSKHFIDYSHRKHLNMPENWGLAGGDHLCVFQMCVLSFSLEDTSHFLNSWWFGLVKKTVVWGENRSRNVFKVSLSTKTLQSPGSFSEHCDPLECHLLYSNSKAFLSPLSLPSLVDLYSVLCPFFLCDASLLLLLLLLPKELHYLAHSSWHLLLVLSDRLEWLKSVWVLVQILPGQQVCFLW